ncbi:MAG: hypothetical protein II843_01425 [Alphaproteobacteria bacterium]|nr:hypothetical protein [Alphaproteobacteria bacterium]
MKGQEVDLKYIYESHENFESMQIPFDIYLQSQQLNQKLLAKVERLTKENLLMEDRLRHIKEFCQANISAMNREHLGRFAKPLNKIVYMCHSALNKLATYLPNKNKDL